MLALVVGTAVNDFVEFYSTTCDSKICVLVMNSEGWGKHKKQTRKYNMLRVLYYICFDDDDDERI